MKTENAPFFVDLEAIVLDKNGLWRSDHTEITHEKTCLLFATNLYRKDRPTQNPITKQFENYEIRVGKETKSIFVEDTPFFVKKMDNEAGNIQITLNDGSTEPLDLSSIQYSPSRLVCVIKKNTRFGKDGVLAKFLRAPYFEFLKDVEKDQSGYFVNVGEKKIRLTPT